MKIKKLDMRGFSHDMALAAFVVIFAISGIAYLVASHADTCSPVSGAVSLVSGAVSSPTSTQSCDTTPPTVPTALRSTATTINSISLAWTASTDTGGSGLAGYHLYRNGNLVASPATSTATGFTDIGLAVGTSYSYTVRAYDNAGNVSAASSPPLIVATKTSGEQLSIPPQRRPVQYLHVCTIGSITYVTQGSPNCIGNGTFQFNYDPSVPGTVYSIPCVTVTPSTSPTSLRFAYISSGEVCPSGTAAVPLKLALGEQVSFPPARRPVQYLHVCTVSSTVYVTQGSPNCIGNGVFQFNYDSSVPGTYYNVPCATISGPLMRYAYIASGASCPVGTFGTLSR